MSRKYVCEVVVVSRTKHPKEVVCSIDQQQLIPKDAAKCLGFWWSWNLAAKMAVDEAMKKARRAFFLFGAFRGDLNPLSGRAIFETCVVPTLLYGCENWILMEDMLLQQDGCQSGRTHKLDEDMGCDFRQRTERDQVHVNTAL